MKLRSRVPIRSRKGSGRMGALEGPLCALLALLSIGMAMSSLVLGARTIRRVGAMEGERLTAVSDLWRSARSNGGSPANTLGEVMGEGAWRAPRWVACARWNEPDGLIGPLVFTRGPLPERDPGHASPPRWLEPAPLDDAQRRALTRRLTALGLSGRAVAHVLDRIDAAPSPGAWEHVP